MCIREAVLILYWASTTLGPRAIWLLSAAGTYRLFSNLDFRRPKLSINEASPRAKPRGTTFQYFYCASSQ
jgi:hypothetical protein